ncbi:nuclear transport factor 2 family protein [Actinomadura kijaniata]|uniref:nuclear transport factor 2 family protein n=1 Tax=Actinomadura kijaniata TaxID=46161 RepID=UPI000832F969|nr:nuclear transport factor 2 family protein [Actinomadura kijaniata]
MSERPGPQEIFERFRRNVLDGGIGLTGDMLAEDAVVETPFAAEGSPRRTEGRAAFLALAEAGREALPVVLTGFRDVVTHRTADPEVLVAEYTLAGRLAGPGRESGPELSAGFVVVLRVRDGRVVHWREYQDTAALQRVLAGI